MELEEMKIQFELLNKKMEQQTIVTENLLRRGMSRNRSFIKNWLITHWAVYSIMLVFVLGNFLSYTSTAFTIATVAFVFSEPLFYTLANLRLLSANFYHQPLVEIVKQTMRAKRLYVIVDIVEFTFAALWLAWFIFGYCIHTGVLKYVIGLLLVIVPAIAVLSWYFYKKVMGVYSAITANANELERINS